MAGHPFYISSNGEEVSKSFLGNRAIKLSPKVVSYSGKGKRGRKEG